MRAASTSGSPRARTSPISDALHGLDPATLDRRIEAAIAALEMGDFADRRAEGFSQGQRVKTAIARALVHDPRNVFSTSRPTAST